MKIFAEHFNVWAKVYTRYTWYFERPPKQSLKERIYQAIDILRGQAFAVYFLQPEDSVRAE